MKKIILYSCLIFTFFACENDKNEFYQSIIKIEEGDIRGLTIGCDLLTVKAQEKDSFLIDQMDDYLYYDYEINMGNSYTVSYDFSPQNTLYEIELTTYLDATKDADQLFNDFSTYFDTNYGKMKTAKDGFNTWINTKNELNKNIEFALINKSESYGIIVIKIRDLNN